MSKTFRALKRRSRHPRPDPDWDPPTKEWLDQQEREALEEAQELLDHESDRNYADYIGMQLDEEEPGIDY